MQKHNQLGTIQEHQPDVESTVNKILENLPSELEQVVDLPSRAKFYTLKDPSEGVKIRAMNFSDEKALVQASSKDSVNILLSRCVSNIDINQLLQFDKLFLLIKIREISFGNKYEVIMICDSCGIKNEVTYDISDFKVNYIPEDLEDPREILLKTIGKTAKVRFPRLLDEDYILNNEKIMDNLWKFVASIDNIENKAIINKVIQKLPSRDVHILMNNIFGSDYGLETKGKVKCDNCGHIQVSELPIGTDFFTMS